ncbi:MAG: cold-shock protein [Flavisolibacter sp.]
MAKSKESFNKKEKEKKRLKQRQEKREKMEERKASAVRGKSLEDMIAYIDEDGNISATPPDPKMKKVFQAEDMVIGVPKQVEGEEEEPAEGIVDHFNETKGFGFIRDKRSGESLFFHVNQLQDRVTKNDRVTYEVERGPKGFNAVNVRKL